jgi:hypothetical protein
MDNLAQKTLLNMFAFPLSIKIDHVRHTDNRKVKVASNLESKNSAGKPRTRRLRDGRGY